MDVKSAIMVLKRVKLDWSDVYRLKPVSGPAISGQRRAGAVRSAEQGELAAKLGRRGVLGGSELGAGAGAS
jgi:hypothetical protein